MREKTLNLYFDAKNDPEREYTFFHNIKIIEKRMDGGLVFTCGTERYLIDPIMLHGNAICTFRLHHIWENGFEWVCADGDFFTIMKTVETFKLENGNLIKGVD